MTPAALPFGDPRTRHPSRASKSRRAAFLRSAPGPPPLRVFPAASAAGEVQVARRPRLTPHKQTRRRSRPTAAGQGSAFSRALVGSWEAVRSEVRAAEVPRLAPRSLSPGGGARDDDEAGKVRRARRQAARHAPCDRHSGVLRGCTNPPGPAGLYHEGQSRSRPLLLEPGAHPGAAPRAHPPRTALPAAPDSSFKPLPGPSFFPSLRVPLRKGRSSPLQSSLTTWGATSTRRCVVGGSGSALRRSASLPGGQTPRTGPE